MSYTGGARVIPTASGGLQFVNGEGVVMFSIASTGKTEFGDASALTNPMFVAPAMTTTQRDNLTVTSSDKGAMIVNTTTSKLNFYNGSAWEAVTSA